MKTFLISVIELLFDYNLLRNKRPVQKPGLSPRGGGGVVPYMGCMCGPKGYGFSAVLVINRVSIIAILPLLW